MNTLLPFIVAGLVSGSVYGLAAMGLVLTYKTSGIFNFAYGALAAAGALVFYYLRTEHGMPWPLAGAISVFVLGPIMGLIFELIARRIAGAAAAWQILATVGVLIVVESLGDIRYAGKTRAFPTFLPRETFRVGGLNVGYDQLIVVLVGLFILAALYATLRYNRMGIAMRAVVDNPELLSMRGESPSRVRRSAWILGSMLASLSGVLISPRLNVDARSLVLVVVQAFGAAAIGYFSNLPLAYAGGLGLGVASALATKYIASDSWLGGLPATLPFVVLLVVLIATPKGRLARESLVPARPSPPSWQAPMRVRLVTGIVIIAVLATVPSWAGTRLVTYTAFLVYIVLFLSLGLLVKLSGQVSLGHLAFAAVGAAGFAHLVNSGVPWGLALFIGGLIAVPVGAVVAIPAIRLSGVFLALATFGFAVVLQQMFYPKLMMFGPTINGIVAPRPGVHWLASPRGFYFLVLVCVLLTVVVMSVVQYGRMGRLLRALADSRIALETHGTTTTLTLVVVFCISAFMAGVGGALLASFYGFATAPIYANFGSLLLFAVLMICIGGAPWYAIVAAAALVVIPSYITADGVVNYLNLLFGLSAIMTALNSDKPMGTPMFIRRYFDRRKPAAAVAITPTPALVEPLPPIDVATAAIDTHHGATAGPALELREISMRFGGVLALDGVGLRAAPGAITGLIGPNGAGKTTLLNVASGLLRPSNGRVLLHDDDVSRHGVAWRARHGVGRTFQRVQLWDSMTVQENVRTAREAHFAGARVGSQLMGPVRQRNQIETASSDAIELVGIGHLRQQLVRNLPAGQRRLVELARSLACPFSVLLLDEPSSGLDPSETVAFGRTLRRVVSERGCSIVLVEHDMSLVMSVCDYIYVIDFGRQLFEGTASEVSASEAVRIAYLGTESAAEETSRMGENAGH
ncbi:MAG: branched-chain amino acid ABC transporter permease/ATP-binding protein [Ilumatobacteraceae bacterium]